ncbi:hypothetical protein [Cupriavidus basilensis]|uniref:hypothetical protein n=1 Tax=Cupriavidus basilensis TaxID=68895 RepID=UPI0002EA230B|nr:hypothetical protein [Cupriavidus basilensis]
MNADLYNRQLHADDQAQAKKLAAQAKAQGLANTDGSPVTETDIDNQLAQMDKRAGGQSDAGGNRIYGVNQAGQQVWTQVLPPADSGLQAFIVQNTGNRPSLPNYTPSTQLPITGPRGPDFVNFQLDYYVGSVWGTFTRDGNSFVGGGANVSIGWLNTGTVTPGQTNNFAGGYAGGATSVFTGVGGGIVVSPGNGTATVIGVGADMGAANIKNPIGFGEGYSSDRGQTGIG